MKHNENEDLSKKSFLRIRGGLPAAEIGEGDFLDPRYEARKGDHRRKPDYSSERLGTRIREAIGLSTSIPSIAGLESFVVSSVAYTGRGNCYLVTLYCTEPEGFYDPAAVRKILKDHKGLLRSDVARSIHRKRVPDLLFEVLPPGVKP